ncbi:MAG: hypothetical protein R3B47_10810 [Bacteroidia bacterium]
MSLKLEVDGETELMIFLSKSGTINRLGGEEEGEKRNTRMQMSRTEEPLFEAWLEGLEPAILEMAGRYTLPDHDKGQACYLELALSGDNIDTGFAFEYGSEGMGPPEEIVELVNRLVAVTD